MIGRRHLVILRISGIVRSTTEAIVEVPRLVLLLNVREMMLLFLLRVLNFCYEVLWDWAQLLLHILPF
jgi:hypothetical protein